MLMVMNVRAAVFDLKIKLALEGRKFAFFTR